MARIGVDARPLSIPTTGIGRYTEALLTRMVRSEHQWFLYSDRPLRVDFSSFPNVHVRTGQLRQGKLSSLYAQWQFPRWARRDRLDVFWSPRHHLPLLLPDSIGKVVTIHDLVWKRFPGTMTRFGRLLERLLMPPSIRAADAVIAVSESTAHELVELFSEAGRKLRTIHEAPFLPLADDVGPLGDYFLFVGTLEPRKNLAGLLRAYSEYVQTADGPLPLKICGGAGWGMQPLVELIQEFELESWVELLGYVNDEQLPHLYRGARALLIPSLYEGFGLPIVEAYSQGTPVMTSNSGAMREVAADGALLVDSQCRHDMRDAMLQLTSAKGIVVDLKARALCQAGRLSWDKAAAETLAVMDRLSVLKR